MSTQAEQIEEIVEERVRYFANRFRNRHEGEVDDPEGIINRKIHNVFLAELDEELQYYAALVRSFDSTLGNMIEKMAIDIAEIEYDVNQSVTGPLTTAQTNYIAGLLEKYKRGDAAPSIEDYQELRAMYEEQDVENVRHESDYHLIDKDTGVRYLVELKIGGDLDNKKARSEKEALLEQYAILCNTLEDQGVHIRFGTAYNRFGEGADWEQGRVRQFFADEELLIGQDFWNFICQSESGYQDVLSAYRNNSHLIMDALQSIKETYLGESQRGIDQYSR